MEQVQPLEPTRSSADVSVALNPASSFASLRSVNQHLLRTDSMCGPVANVTHASGRKPRRKAVKSKARAKRDAMNVSRVMSKHFPLLLESLPPPSSSPANAGSDDAGSLGSPPRLSSLREGGSRKQRSGKGTRRRRGLASSGKRLFDPRLTASAMDEIQWLPRFRESISRATNTTGGTTTLSRPGSFNSSAMSGAMKTFGRSSKSVPVPREV